MKIVAWGGGVNSTAMIIGLHQQSEKIDYILFCDTGSERPEIYEYRDIFNSWLKANDLPEIITLYYVYERGERQSLEEDLLRQQVLPPPCYGGKSCSEKYKTRVQNKFCNNNDACKAIWSSGEKIDKYIGFDAGEERRKDGAYIYDILDKKYSKHYPLIDWEWYREDCVKAIAEAGLPIPPKSSCFFCPNMKQKEIRQLYQRHRALYDRAVTLERNGMAKTLSPDTKGLGRRFSWEAFIEADKRQ